MIILIFRIVSFGIAFAFFAYYMKCWFSRQALNFKYEQILKKSCALPSDYYVVDMLGLKKLRGGRWAMQSRMVLVIPKCLHLMR